MEHRKILGVLIDRSSFKGSVFIFNYSAIALTRLVTGQLDAYIDITGWLVDDGNNSTPLPQLSTPSPIVGLFAYDIATAYLIARESQCVIPDAWGEPLDDQSLIGDKVLFCIAASNLELHRRLIDWLTKND